MIITYVVYVGLLFIIISYFYDCLEGGTYLCAQGFRGLGKLRILVFKALGLGLFGLRHVHACLLLMDGGLYVDLMVLRLKDFGLLFEEGVMLSSRHDSSMPLAPSLSEKGCGSSETSNGVSGKVQSLNPT